ncbi:MAG: tetratricopeptide repeat protein [Candidatus Gastranaerophilales bacterium]|nr:tetratricopeptide repeat protein [Candidatus Gastranaerophilales bacterium]MCM1073404.1 tetratricopeptide repeat protein [Bacteroides sp.]
MKRLALLLVLFLGVNGCFANEELSKQATAFYSDNNHNKTMDLLLQIDENERSAQDWLLLGNLLDEKGEKSNAIFMYQKAINTDKKYYKAYYNLANLYLADERYNMAVENYKKAVSLNKENPYVFYNLGCAYLKLGEVKKARSAFQQAVTLKNDVAEFHYNLAYTYKSLGKTKMAQIYLDNYNKLNQG